MYVFSKLSKGYAIEEILHSDMKINLFIRYSGVVLYPALFLMEIL
jgi:hypothetical protein